MNCFEIANSLLDDQRVRLRSMHQGERGDLLRLSTSCASHERTESCFQSPQYGVVRVGREWQKGNALFEEASYFTSMLLRTIWQTDFAYN